MVVMWCCTSIIWSGLRIYISSTTHLLHETNDGIAKQKQLCSTQVNPIASISTGYRYSHSLESKVSINRTHTHSHLNLTRNKHMQQSKNIPSGPTYQGTYYPGTPLPTQTQPKTAQNKTCPSQANAMHDSATHIPPHHRQDPLSQQICPYVCVYV